MGPDPRWLIPLDPGALPDVSLVGGKAHRLASLARAGFRTPGGICVTTHAYRDFVARHDLARIVRAEIGRKPFDTMRWEEVWDAALRIRSAFLAADPPPRLADELARALDAEPPAQRWAVRSSAPSEDAAGASFAGLHESRVGLAGTAAVVDAVRVVWASLWSDAALLYRRELGLDPAQSAMAVLVQPMLEADRSGVAFGRDPREPERERAIVEVVPGPCADLVDGRVDPDRFVLARPDGSPIEWRAGERGEPGEPKPLLDADDLVALMRALIAVEAAFGWPPDLEWIGRRGELALLQARPIVAAPPADGDDPRAWSLSLRPRDGALARLCDHVEHELIPALEAEIARFAAEDVVALDDGALADAIDARRVVLAHWRQVYWAEFIPLAHGVRRLGSYYDEAVRPRDPYEFVGLLRHAPLSATARNERIVALAAQVRESATLRGELEKALAGDADALAGRPEARAFACECYALLRGVMDVCYANERLAGRPDLLWRLVLALAERSPAPTADDDAAEAVEAERLEHRLLDAVGPERAAEAREVLRIGRVSWRLRDDDNLLLGRIESQLLTAVTHGLERLRAAGRLDGDARPDPAIAPIVADALRDASSARIAIAAPEPTRKDPDPRPAAGTPRQLVGQPAGPGFATGPACRIRCADDFARFRAGDVLVCDAIQPTMTHLVPLASAIVERRGGMLIHGAIIARELGIPCVNGVAAAVEQICDGDALAIDGDYGLVTVGPPDFELELGAAASAADASPGSAAG